ncbi:hypothetical protein, partial [Candidatus Entotheonella palauensis]|uniref:hypothetical protein n=1 Tax=Candidatus Entotheonella palauensis TaxID=93172 RepID=UPI001C4DE807
TASSALTFVNPVSSAIRLTISAFLMQTSLAPYYPFMASVDTASHARNGHIYMDRRKTVYRKKKA